MERSRWKPGLVSAFRMRENEKMKKSQVTPMGPGCTQGTFNTPMGLAAFLLSLSLPFLAFLFIPSFSLSHNVVRSSFVFRHVVAPERSFLCCCWLIVVLKAPS